MYPEYRVLEVKYGPVYPKYRVLEVKYGPIYPKYRVLGTKYRVLGTWSWVLNIGSRRRSSWVAGSEASRPRTLPLRSLMTIGTCTPYMAVYGRIQGHIQGPRDQDPGTTRYLLVPPGYPVYWRYPEYCTYRTLYLGTRSHSDRCDRCAPVHTCLLVTTMSAVRSTGHAGPTYQEVPRRLYMAIWPYQDPRYGLQEAIWP